MKMKSYRFIIILVLIGIAISCKKESPITAETNNNVIDPDFIFYPTKNAVWIIKSYHVSQTGTYNFLDTIYLGKDTIMTSRTHHPNTTVANADPPSLKTYHEIRNKSLAVSPTFDTVLNEGRQGWFREEIVGMKIYAPYYDMDDNMIYDKLMLNFNLNIGDTTDFTISGYPYVVKNVDSIAFGNRYLKHILFGYPSNTQIEGEIIQAYNFASYNLIGSGIQHPGITEWKKFIYKTDTLFFEN